jgi:ElaB/YqjD/DUF883 family membrane-anchored ribosome-binding protein
MLERTAAQSAALAEELRNVVRQAEKLLVALGEDREEALVELRQHVTVAVAEAKKRLADFEEQARRLKDTAGAAMDVYVRENPWTAVSIGAALGVLLGAWIASEGGSE